jgi:hypothetical protein
MQQPYLGSEPKASVTAEGINGFFLHVFSRDITTEEANLHLSDPKYSLKPQEAEMLLQNKLNGCIDSLSPVRNPCIGKYLYELCGMGY